MTTGTNAATVFCAGCDAERGTREETRTQALSVRGEPIAVVGQVLVCLACGQDITDPVRDDEVLVRAYNVYRTRHGLLLPREIRALRERYRLSQRAMAKLLGFGLITIQRYEAGALQDAAHDQLLRCFADPKTARAIADRHRGDVSPRQWQLFDQAAQAAADGKPIRPEVVPDLPTTDWETLATAVRYLVSRAAQRHLMVSRTKLLKLWWLADFLHFRSFARPITDVAYVALARGPVPDRYKDYLWQLEDKGEIEEVETPYGPYEGYEYRVVDRESGESLAPTERACIEAVVDHFGSLSAAELSDMSHHEPLWPTFEADGRVPYEAAADLKMLDGLAEEARDRL